MASSIGKCPGISADHRDRIVSNFSYVGKGEITLRITFVALILLFTDQNLCRMIANKARRPQCL